MAIIDVLPDGGSLVPLVFSRSGSSLEPYLIGESDRSELHRISAIRALIRARRNLLILCVKGRYWQLLA